MARVGHIPTRMCRICRTKKPKLDLTRWTNTGNGWIKNVAGSGRGTYTCSLRCEELLLTKFGKR